MNIALAPRDIIERNCCVVGSNVGTLGETEAALQYTVRVSHNLAFPGDSELIIIGTC